MSGLFRFSYQKGNFAPAFLSDVDPVAQLVEQWPFKAKP